MTTLQEYERYEVQQRNTEAQEIVETLKKNLCKSLEIPDHKIKSGNLTPLIHGETNTITRFIER